MTSNRTLNSLLLAGLATGAVAWYLFGTRSGKEFLNSIMDSTKDVGESIKENVKSKLDDLSNQAKDLAEKTKSHAY